MNTPEDRIDFIKRDKGLTFGDLAGFIGDISSNAVRIALKRKNLKRIYLNKLANNLNINKSWLFEGEGDIYNKFDFVNEESSNYGNKGITLLEIRDDLKADLLDIKKNSAKKQHIQALSDSLAENLESISGALLKILEHNEKVEDFMDQIDLKALKEATKSLNK